MTIAASLLSVAFVYWFLMSFLSQLTRPETPDAILTQMEYKRGESTAAA